eukprot:gene44432-59289_t
MLLRRAQERIERARADSANEGIAQEPGRPRFRLDGRRYMTTPTILPSFAAGELSPALHGRVDLAKYQVGLATCLNWFVHPFGGVSTRAGTAFVGEVYRHTGRSRLVPFAFNTTQTYVLEFADQKMRVIKDGGYVLESALTITGITNGARTTGGNSYVTTNNVSFGYSGSAVSFTGGGRTMVITVGATCTGTCSAVGTQTTAATLSMRPATSITDTAGNLVLTTTRSASIRLF